MRQKVASLSELKEAKRKLISLDSGQEALLFYSNDTVYAVESLCPHEGGPLSEGELKGEEIICPWHEWRFDITNGKCLNMPGFDLKHYDVEVEDDIVFLNEKEEA